MAVPPEGSKIVFNAILKTFAGIEYDSVPALERLQLKNLRGTKKKEIKELVASL